MAERDPGPFQAAASIREVEAADAAALDTLLREATTPFVIRGLVAHWPLVAAARRSPRAARDYLLDLSRDMDFTVSVGQPQDDGRLFYNEDATAMNFNTFKGKLPGIFAQFDKGEELGDARAIYIASTDVHQYFDGLHDANHVDLGKRDLLASIWIGTHTRIAAHNDFPDNLACVAAGRRRFTLFPPDQFRNLYLGPVDNTPAGRAVSMIDFHAPDFDRFPRFRDALKHAQIADLEPGDALHIPSMWWHHVEGLEGFNILVNYWWRETPRWLGQPQDALNHAMLSIRDLPEDEKAHWRDLFDYYVFGDQADVVAHIPEPGRSVLAPLTPEKAARIRSFILRQLSR